MNSKDRDSFWIMMFGGLFAVVIGVLVIRYLQEQRSTYGKDPFITGTEQFKNYIYDVCVDYTCYPEVVKYEADPYCVKVWRKGGHIKVDCGDINIALRRKDSKDTSCRCDF